MRSPVQDMLEKYQCRHADDYRNALKEIVQEIALLGLSRGGFFNHAAFYGGTVLRIFHGLDRFSEDLDFSLLQSNTSFELEEFLPYVRDELGSYGFNMNVQKKVKAMDTAVQSAFIKGGTLVQLVSIASISPPVSGVLPDEVLKIKFEVDTDPPTGAEWEVKSQLNPVSYSVRLYDKPSLFSGKLHALLCRNWKQRVKGRDFYDYLWYLSHQIPVNIWHLEQRLRQSGHWNGSENLSRISLVKMLEDRFATVDFLQAKKDIAPYIADSRVLDVWSQEFFSESLSFLFVT